MSVATTTKLERYLSELLGDIHPYDLHEIARDIDRIQLYGGEMIRREDASEYCGCYCSCCV